MDQQQSPLQEFTPAPQPSAPKDNTKKIIIIVAIVLVVLLALCACGCIGFSLLDNSNMMNGSWNGGSSW